MLRRKIHTQIQPSYVSLSVFLHPLVICSFRGAVPQGLVLELGETVQILEKCEGKCDGQERTPFSILEYTNILI